MRWMILALTLPLAALAGCHAAGENDDPSRNEVGVRAVAAADCLPRIRYAGKVYNATGYTSIAAKPAGRADLANCADVGKHARGSYFPDHARTTRAYVFEEVPRGTAMAIRAGGAYDVYISADIPTSRAERILLTKLDGGFDPPG